MAIDDSMCLDLQQEGRQPPQPVSATHNLGRLLLGASLLAAVRKMMKFRAIVCIRGTAILTSGGWWDQSLSSVDLALVQLSRLPFVGTSFDWEWVSEE